MNWLHQLFTASPRPLFWWRPRPHHPKGIKTNFGDELNPALYQWLTDQEARRAQSNDRRKTLAIGSVLTHALPGDVVWGSGLNGKVRDEAGNIQLPKRPDAITFRAVRGPLTRQLLVEAGAEVPEVYGDPSLLMRFFIKPPEQRRGTLVIPHYTDTAALMEQWKPRDETMLWSMDASAEATIAAINSAERVVSSALHGIIVAEALGVPVVPMRIGHVEHPFKFQDYWLGTGRDPLPFVEGFQAALDAEAPPTVEFPDALFSELLAQCPFPLSDKLSNLSFVSASGE